MIEKKSILIVEQNMNFNEVFVEHISQLPYTIGNFFESWDQPFKYSFKNKLKNIYHRNILRNKNYIESLKQEQYNSFCEKCIHNFEKRFTNVFDYCIIFRADRLPEFLINYLSKKSNKTITYQYDSLSVSEKILHYKNYLHKIFVFDPADLQYRADNLAFTTNYHFNISYKKSNSIFMYYLGVWKATRYQKLCNLLRNSEVNKFKNKIFLIDSNELSENKEIQIIKAHIPYKMYLKEIIAATVLIDIKLEVHNGLSFRFFEALNFKKKIITNNHSIKNYNFYHPDNVFITDFENFDGLAEFMQKPYQTIPENIVKMYSFENWIKNILEIDDYIAIPLPKTDTFL
ncbi:hypothetical protein PGH12_13910 [Chryseobacterium wangxinyae]|uniref:hypothetical protein n=1 Tax=Chryseobacterium sp. CY350 TaxID=2997336 RepID=UPI00226EC629|nr:hypothetical protein [Chryseobacterium sp. CY350]MCY0975831.1 hypothetical protein [Chryseobacterium sp. CY350]WBZ94560.1 hypothetical protein PGH12_13910 [Chryseobacterium sp. CY350]